MDRATLEEITEAVLAALQRGDLAWQSSALLFLLRRYRETDRGELGEALGLALAHALDRDVAAAPRVERAGWLVLFSQAARLAEDDRLDSAAAHLAGALRRDWGKPGAVGDSSTALDAWLAWCRLFDPPPVLAEAIDELERIVGEAYRPGQGLTATGSAGGPVGEYVRLSSVLLTGFEVTGRLPYSMLAEELMQHARRTLWSDATGAFQDAAVDSKSLLVLNSEAGRVFCRLAALHLDADYRRAAVIAPDADYANDAACILNAKKPSCLEEPESCAAYGLALADWLELQERTSTS